jgi:translation elongation factor EF-Tu-like GTPase
VVPGKFSWLADGIEMVMPGDNARVAVNLDKPVALDIGSHFAIREGGKPRCVFRRQDAQGSFVSTTRTTRKR